MGPQGEKENEKDTVCHDRIGLRHYASDVCCPGPQGRFARRPFGQHGQDCQKGHQDFEDPQDYQEEHQDCFGRAQQVTRLTTSTRGTPPRRFLLQGRRVFFMGA